MIKNNEKMVCIGLPVYNGAIHLRQSLDSLLVQSYADFIVIALDDGSSDESLKILNEYKNSDARIYVYKNRRNKGLIKAWNRVAKIAGQHNPKYFAWYSDHDFVSPDWLEAQLRELENNPAIALTGVNTIEIDGSGAIVGSEIPGINSLGLDEYSKLKLATGPKINAGNAVYGLFRYEYLNNFGFLPTELLPDKLLVSGMILYGDVTTVANAVRYRRIYEWNENVDEMLSRQSKNLFDSRSAALNRDILSHSTFFIRRFLKTTKYIGKSKSIATQLVHALLFHNKYHEANVWKYCTDDHAIAYYQNGAVDIDLIFSYITDDSLFRANKRFIEKFKKIHSKYQVVKNLNAEVVSKMKDLSDKYKLLKAKYNTLKNMNKNQPPQNPLE